MRALASALPSTAAPSDIVQHTRLLLSDGIVRLLAPHCQTYHGLCQSLQRGATPHSLILEANARALAWTHTLTSAHEFETIAACITTELHSIATAGTALNISTLSAACELLTTTFEVCAIHAVVQNQYRYWCFNPYTKSNSTDQTNMTVNKYGQS